MFSGNKKCGDKFLSYGKIMKTISSEFISFITPREEKRVHHRLTSPFTRKSLLAEISYNYYDWFRSLKQENGDYLSCL